MLEGLAQRLTLAHDGDRCWVEMGILDRHILKEVFIATFFAVVILCGVFLMGTIFKEARPLLVGKNPSPWLLLQFIGSVLPLSLMFMLPCSFLAAILITMGRLSSQNELTAIHMSGRSLYRVAVPIFALAAAMCGFCFFVNTSFAPQAKAMQKRILYEAVQTDPNKFLDPGVVKHQLKDKIVFVHGREENELSGLYVYDSNPDKTTTHFPKSHIYARQAKLFIDSERKQLRLRLGDAIICSDRDKNEAYEPVFVQKMEPLLFDFSVEDKKNYKVSSMTSDELQDAMISDDPAITEELQNSLRNEYYGRYAFSMSCFSLAFVGIPLAISRKRRETSTGFIIAIGVTVLYFSFFIVANDKRDEEFAKIQSIYWAPNVLAVIVGGYLFSRSQKK